MEFVPHVIDTPYGLNAMVFTENLSRAHRASSSRNSDPRTRTQLVPPGKIVSIYPPFSGG
jgi:hypothetical protein